MNSQLLTSEFSPTPSKTRAKLILSVDDEPSILQTREAILLAQGYLVLSASDGENALDLFDGHPVIRLVLIDYAMPGMDGAAIAQAMKFRRPSVPIFMITAYEAALPKSALTCVDCVISKGTGPFYLLEKINQLLAPTASRYST